LNNNIDTIDLEDELFEHFRFEVPKGSILAIDKYLMSLIQNATRNKIQTAATEGNIFVNDATVKSNYKVKANDVVRVMLTHPPYENHIIPENIPLDIVYE
jgi:23S rRNA pseudouridine1911/1915/1917 synthase